MLFICALFVASPAQAVPGHLYGLPLNPECEMVHTLYNVINGSHGARDEHYARTWGIQNSVKFRTFDPRIQNRMASAAANIYMSRIEYRQSPRSVESAIGIRRDCVRLMKAR